MEHLIQVIYFLKLQSVKARQSCRISLPCDGNRFRCLPLGYIEVDAWRRTSSAVQDFEHLVQYSQICPHPHYSSCWRRYHRGNHGHRIDYNETVSMAIIIIIIILTCSSGEYQLSGLWSSWFAAHQCQYCCHQWGTPASSPKPVHVTNHQVRFYNRRYSHYMYDLGSLDFFYLPCLGHEFVIKDVAIWSMAQIMT